MIDIDRLLHGSIDMHIHPGPDNIPRRLDVLEAARQAQQAGMRAIVIKNHYYPTAPLAYLVNQLVPGIQVFGSLCLDHGVGGLNSYAVKNSAVLGAKVIWMPTFSAADPRSSPNSNRKEKGISIIDGENKLLPEVTPILELVKQNNMILATGHISPLETKILIDAAVKAGISKMIITHPLERGMIDQALGLEELRRLAQTGALIELTVTGLLPTASKTSLPGILEAIKAIGADHFIMSTDLGQAHNPTPVEGIRMFIATLLQKGITPKEIELMVKVNPGRLLGLE
jgi:hypothetical protein